MNFDRILAVHCSPTLAGIKPASLASLTQEELAEWIQSMERFNDMFGQKGFQIEILCSCKKRVLFLLYHKEKLSMWLRQTKVTELLSEIGYPLELEVRDIVRYLAERIHKLEDFPHEIGAILGYPITDVIGFMEHKGKNYKACGYWKVYGDVEYSERLFYQYRICKNSYCEAVRNGATIEELLSIA